MRFHSSSSRRSVTAAASCCCSAASFSSRESYRCVNTESRSTIDGGPSGVASGVASGVSVAVGSERPVGASWPPTGVPAGRRAMVLPIPGLSAAPSRSGCERPHPLRSWCPALVARRGAPVGGPGPVSWDAPGQLAAGCGGLVSKTCRPSARHASRRRPSPAPATSSSSSRVEAAAKSTESSLAADAAEPRQQRPA